MKNKDNTAIKMESFINELFGEVRSIIIDNEPWFVGADVARCLEYVRPNDAITDNIYEEDRRFIRHGELPCLKINPRGTYIINESGVYSLIFSSKMPKAREFQYWVTHDILPAMRKIGFEESQKLIQQKYYEKGMYQGRKAESLKLHNNTQNLNELISDLYEALDIAANELGINTRELIFEAHIKNNTIKEHPFIYYDENKNEISKEKYNLIWRIDI